MIWLTFLFSDHMLSKIEYHYDKLSMELGLGGVNVVLLLVCVCLESILVLCKNQVLLLRWFTSDTVMPRMQIWCLGVFVQPVRLACLTFTVLKKLSQHLKIR